MTHTHETPQPVTCPTGGRCLLHPSVHDRLAALRAAEHRCPGCGAPVPGDAGELYDDLDLMSRPRTIAEWHSAAHLRRARQLGGAQ